jgi:hypothetical protein
MLRANLWNKSVSRVELDQRAREARLRLQRIERLLVPRAAVTNSWLRRVFYVFRLGIYGNASPGNQTTGPLSNRRPSRLPKIHQVEPECGFVLSRLRASVPTPLRCMRVAEKANCVRTPYPRRTHRLAALRRRGPHLIDRVWSALLNPRLYQP